MGWTGHVAPITQFVAQCSNSWFHPELRDCDWVGPMRNSYEQAHRDMDRHCRRHAVNYERYQRTLEDWHHE